MRLTSLVSSLLLILATIAGAQTAPAPTAEQQLQAGEESFRSGHYAEAAEALRAAAAGFLTAEQKQQYIETGKLATLPQLEESLVYLALTWEKLGRPADARDAVARLLNAERIAPTYASLPLRGDAARFEALAAELFPSTPLPPNVQLAGGVAQSAAPVQTAEVPPPQPIVVPATPAPAVTAAHPSPVETTQAVVASQPAAVATPPPTPVPAPAPAAVVASAPAAAPQPAETQAAARPADMPPQQSAEQRAEMLRLVEEKVAEERARIEKEANARIAEAQREADARIARERESAEQAAREQIARDREATQKAAADQIAKERAAIEQAAREQIVRERETATRAAQERLAEEQSAADRAARQARETAEAESRREMLGRLAEAESMAADGRTEDAIRAFVAIANAPAASREAVAAAATGLYRTGDFVNASAAFTRLGTFARGEEDLRYYAAVALYETGRYDEARRQLECALPFIEVTPDVVRYRTRIELSAPKASER